MTDELYYSEVKASLELILNNAIKKKNCNKENL